MVTLTIKSFLEEVFCSKEPSLVLTCLLTIVDDLHREQGGGRGEEGRREVDQGPRDPSHARIGWQAVWVLVLKAELMIFKYICKW